MGVEWKTIKIWEATYWNLKMLAATMKVSLAEALDISINNQLRMEMRDGKEDKQDYNRRQD
jgi:hypothetical protein